MTGPVARQLEAVKAASARFVAFLQDSAWSRRAGREGVCDFVAGNPQEMALPGYVEAILKASTPRDPSWFAYKASEQVARDVVAASLNERLGVGFRSEDVCMTKGASSALAIVLRTVLDPG